MVNDKKDGKMHQKHFKPDSGSDVDVDLDKAREFLQGHSET